MAHTFPLDPAVLGSGSAASLDLAATTDADVLAAVATNQPFPTRPSGVIDLTHISLSASGGKPVALQTKSGLTVGFDFSAGVTAGVAVFDNAEAAIRSLELGESPGLDLSFAAPAGTRFCLLRAGYQASGSVSGSHPIGAIGSFTFGVSGAAAGLTAVLHRFAATTGADTVLKETVSSWKLPRHVDSASRLAPGTWLVTEASGSVAVKLGAQLGYNFDFIREVKAFGLSGDIGLKLDAAATATFGFDVSGRYLVVVGREADNPADNSLRLRLFKLRAQGMQFGLNLKVGVTGVETLTPNSVDDFVKAVFGVHGAQIVGALQQIEKWTNPNASVGELVAGLVNTKALELIEEVTGIDPKTAFNAARAKLLEAVKLYENLPATVSSELLGILKKISPAESTQLINALTLLAETDTAKQKAALLDIMGASKFLDTPAGRLISSFADRGLLNLFDRLPEVRSMAGTVLSILNGDVIRKLQDFIGKKLNLDQVLKVATQTDFDKLDSFLVGRLSAFFDKTLHFSDLNEIKNAINLVVSKRQEIYEKARKALNSRYALEISATWQRTSSSTALVDAVFDMSDTAAQTLFKTVVAGDDAGLDKLFTTALPSVRLNTAVLTHELTRKTTLDVSLPMFNFQTQSVVTAFANVRAEDDGGRVLLFDASGTSAVTVRNKFVSSLTVTIAAMVRASAGGELPDLRVHSVDSGTWAYRLRYVKVKMQREELEAITRPFVVQYLADHFTQMNLSKWYNQLERTSEGILNNGPDVFGDTCLSLEVSVPGDVVRAWAQPVSNVNNAAKAVSIAIQRALKPALLMFYLNDISKLGNLASSAPLLAWASVPPAVRFDGTTFSTTSGNDVYWDHVDVTLRKAAAQHPQTSANLVARLAESRIRLEEAGMHGTVQFYQDDQAGAILKSATSQFGDVLLRSLFFFESDVVLKAAEALKDIQKFLKVAGSSPTKATKLLAEFAADIVTAFNKLTGNSVFADLASFRAVSQVVFLEASRALAPNAAATPSAMLALDILHPAPPRTFQLPAFLEGNDPASADVAVSQRLVSTD